MLSLSRRARELGTENAFVVLGEVERLQAEGREIVSFCIGQPDFVTPETIRMAGVKAITDGHTGYTASPGIPLLRQSVAAYFSCWFVRSLWPTGAQMTRALLAPLRPCAVWNEIRAIL